MAASQFDYDLFTYQAPELTPLKTCWMCQKAKPLPEFGKDASRSDGLNPRCKSCSTQDHVRRQAAKQPPERKVCLICKGAKPLSLFGFAETTRRVPWLKRHCIECEAKAGDRQKANRKPAPRSQSATAANKRYRKRLKVRETVEVWSERRCVTCRTVKPSDQFHRNRSEQSGLATRCKPCKANEHKARYDKKAADYKPAEHGICASCGLDKPAKEFHRQVAAASGLSGYCILCAKRKSIQSYSEDQRARIMAVWLWQKQNPGKDRAIRISYRCNKRARLAGAEGSFSPMEWRELLAHHKYQCFYCNKSETPEVLLTVDHKIPLSRAGTGWISNIAPSCLSCNATKGDKTPEEYAVWREINAKVLRVHQECRPRVPL